VAKYTFSIVKDSTGQGFVRDHATTENTVTVEAPYEQIARSIAAAELTKPEHVKANGTRFLHAGELLSVENEAPPVAPVPPQVGKPPKQYSLQEIAARVIALEAKEGTDAQTSNAGQIAELEARVTTLEIKVKDIIGEEPKAPSAT